MKSLLDQLRRMHEAFLGRITSAEHVSMMVVAAVVGALGGLGAVGFRMMIRGVQRLSWGDVTYSVGLVTSHPWWWILLLPFVGGLLVGPIIQGFAKEAKGHGVPEVMEAVALHNGVIRPRLVVVKSIASALTIGTGGSVGREGPIVQIGSALGSTIGRWLRVSGSRLRTLVGCGAAAGIAATFNAPIAGALFAVEIVLGDFGVAQFSPIVISSVMATVVSRHFLGNHPAFDVPPHGLVSAWELIVYVILGVAAAGVALAFIWLVYRLEELFESLPLPEWLLPSLGGLLVGGIGVFGPQVLGVGYETINVALEGQVALGVLLALVILKLLATSLTLGSGASGGIFAPSLFLGAMLGGAIGTVAHHWFPGVTAGAGAYALVGMGAVVAGSTHAPITAILIIFELTTDYTLILPLMAACIISTVVATRVRPASIYTLKLLRRGVDLLHGRELNVLKPLEVREVMSADVLKVAEDEALAELVERMSDSRARTLYVTGEDGAYLGRIEFEELRQVLLQADILGGLVLAGDLARDAAPAVTPDESLDTVMRLFAGRSPDELPVVDSESGKLEGIVTRQHLLDAYNQELLKQDMVSGMGDALASSSGHELHLGKDFRMVEVDAPGSFVGHALGDLGVRSRYHVQVLLVRRSSRPDSEEGIEVVPGPETVVERGDRLVVVGRDEDVDRMSRW